LWAGISECGAEEVVWWRFGEVNRRMEKTAIRFRREKFVAHLRNFGEMKTIYKSLSESLKAVSIIRLKE
jgi:hypothetical protein